MLSSQKLSRTLNLHLAIAAACTVCTASFPACGAGPDVILSNIPSVSSFGPVNGVRAYALGSGTCNIGTQNLEWINAGSPGLAMNAYRLHDGRLVQIGLSFVKTACCAINTNGCNLACTGGSSNALGVGCKDTYSSSWNAGQGRLGPRSKINPYTGVFESFPQVTGDAIFRRLQIAEADLNPLNFPGALFFVEGVYASTGDAQALNWHNNATYQRATFNSYQLALVGTGVPTVPAIYAWRDHGLGPNVPDPSVTIVPVDVPAEGRFFLATKVRDNHNGTWRYDYAVYNLNSHQSAATFTIPVPPSVNVTDIGFHDVNYHSGEVFSNTDWTKVRASDEVRWSSPQTFAENPNANALRWGTMYNFWFTADCEPSEFGKTVQAELGLFRPGPVASVTLATQGPKPAPCLADVVPPGGNGVVGIDDLLAVINAWGPCDQCDADITGDGEVNVNDLLMVINGWGTCG